MDTWTVASSLWLLWINVAMSMCTQISVHEPLSMLWGIYTPHVFINKALLEHNHTHSLTYCPWPLSYYNDRVVSLLLRPYGSEAQDISCVDFTENVGQPVIYNICCWAYFGSPEKSLMINMASPSPEGLCLEIQAQLLSRHMWHLMWPLSCLFSRSRLCHMPHEGTPICLTHAILLSAMALPWHQARVRNMSFSSVAKGQKGSGGGCRAGEGYTWPPMEHRPVKVVLAWLMQHLWFRSYFLLPSLPPPHLNLPLVLTLSATAPSTPVMTLPIQGAAFYDLWVSELRGQDGWEAPIL